MFFYVESTEKKNVKMNDLYAHHSKEILINVLNYFLLVFLSFMDFVE